MKHKKEIQIDLNFYQGSLQDGFDQVILQKFQAGHVERKTINLEAAPEIEETYNQWNLLYSLVLYQIRRNSPEIEFDLGTPTHISELDFDELIEGLKYQLNQLFTPIRERLNYWLKPDDEIRLTLTTTEEILCKLPWHLLSFFDDYPMAELALSGSQWRLPNYSKTQEGKVRILAVIGDSTGLDLNIDRKLLEAIPGVDLVLLDQPSRIELDNWLWDEKGWDIWFFAGHSFPSETSGCIQINTQDSLTIGQLKNALNASIEKGLQIAIFNSCEGLALTKELAQLQLPYSIVMSQPVADNVAQNFLKYFLQSFAGERKSFYLSVRKARERLQGLEKDFPCATWLPMIYQNQAPTQTPPSWEQLKQSGPQNWSFPLGMSAAVGVIMIVLRGLGLFAGVELEHYDRFMRWRFDEGPDSRLLLVAGENESRYGFPVSDQVLAEVIEKLDEHQPRVMGLNIFRYTQRPPGRDRLENILANHPDLIGICTQNDSAPTGNPPIATMPSQRLGFVNIHYDPDEVLRRISLFQTPSLNESCRTDSYLGWQLAFNYLRDENIEPEVLPDNRVKLDRVTLQELPSYSGVYGQKGKWGFEMLLNYRAGKTPFQTITFEDILNDEFHSHWIQDKVVIIGMALPNDPNDRHFTPYSPYDERMPGMMIVAHTTSQLLSAALDGRSLLWVMPFWAECLWIIGWSIIGGISAWCYRRFLWWTLITGTQWLTLYFLCWLILLLNGGWLPVIPALLGLTASGISTGLDFYQSLKPKRLNN